MKWLVGLTHLKDTREDIKVGTGEGLEIVQVADDSSDDILKIEGMELSQKIKKIYEITGVTLTRTASKWDSTFKLD